MFLKYLCLCLIFYFTEASKTGNYGGRVNLKTKSNLKQFEIASGRNNITTWMSIRRGIFPNTTDIDKALLIGEPITIFIYLKDDSNLYDMKVSSCWAYDNGNIDLAENKLLLTPQMLNNKRAYRRTIKKWNKMKISSDHGYSILVYGELNAFKFPEKESLYFVCDVELCFKSCAMTYKMKKRYEADFK